MFSCEICKNLNNTFFYRTPLEAVPDKLGPCRMSLIEHFPIMVNDFFLLWLLVVNPFYVTGVYTPWKQLTTDFLIFSGGIERDQWYEMN